MSILMVFYDFRDGMNNENVRSHIWKGERKEQVAAANGREKLTIWQLNHASLDVHSEEHLLETHDRRATRVTRMESYGTPQGHK
ncbi:hypothetical protein POVCU2_0099990 [Plasmodium ovale curtisi]|uniref:Uncharacterized protein n=1 Tax=Plasmodium ovale curtisi TaxID=864141 RepID=A0A1A8WSL5_PLAOA|nr:hypothetical protein POVCU2_0099990 [Plasmodium ovale curtisi]SBS96312.1 hypothetical protein POVCU1_032020 [Plasmodium ovale curtisi]